ncbi:hypothetical protein ACIRF8_12730 [Streptomyces sp. NPDC102406]|uniref:hypothetical protein n=1 Tax=Streptomyces sp. NPDC102406 TaxID=3366171 RepID=UPI00380CB0F5
MPVQLGKPNPEDARRAAQRGAEVHEVIVAMARAMAPAVQKAGEEITRSFNALKRPTVHGRI